MKTDNDHVRAVSVNDHSGEAANDPKKGVPLANRIVGAIAVLGTATYFYFYIPTLSIEEQHSAWVGFSIALLYLGFRFNADFRNLVRRIFDKGEDENK